MNRLSLLSLFLCLAFSSASLGAQEAAASAEEIHPLMVGAEIPDVALQTADGETFPLQAAVADQPTVLVFFRGGWCPYCSSHLGRIQEVEAELTELGYRILAISPDRPARIRENLERAEGAYQLLSDADMSVCRAFGIAYQIDPDAVRQYRSYGIDLEEASGHPHHQLPVPAVFLVGGDGVIDFSYVNPDYRVRLDPDILLAAAKVYRNS